MILTVTLNPLLERRLHFEKLKQNEIHRGGRERLLAGGKGINVSRQLNLLGIDNLAFTFIGGNNGKLLKECLIREGIKFTSVRINDETRWAAVIINEEDSTLSTYFSSDPAISTNEVEEFKVRLEKMIQNCEMVVFSGSAPTEDAASIIPFGIDTANKFDKISICDTYGSSLMNCIDASPTILHNNLDELRLSLNQSLSTQREISELLSYLYSRDIKQVHITDGENDSYVSNFDFHYKIINSSIETIDSTGSGDSYVAGLIYGLHNGLTFEETIKIASSLGAANALRLNVCDVKLDEINELKSEIKIESIGKKMKTLNDTPS
jgi:1-phosphofructokinase family hexose kinase